MQFENNEFKSVTGWLQQPVVWCSLGNTPNCWGKLVVTLQSTTISWCQQTRVKLIKMCFSPDIFKHISFAVGIWHMATSFKTSITSLEPLLENRPFILPLFLSLVPIFLCSGLKGLLVPVVSSNKDTKFLPQVCGDGRQQLVPVIAQSRDPPTGNKSLLPAWGSSQD